MENDEIFFVYYVEKNEEKYMQEFKNRDDVQDFAKSNPVILVIIGRDITSEFPSSSKI